MFRYLPRYSKTTSNFSSRDIPHCAEKILYNWKISQVQTGVVGDCAERYSLLISVFANLSQLSTKGLPVLTVKKKNSFAMCLNNSTITKIPQGTPVVSWAESTRCTHCLNFQTNSVQSSFTTLVSRKQLPSKS